MVRRGFLGRERWRSEKRERRKGGKFNPYKAAFYNLAIEEIDKTLGNEVGTLKNFKRYFKDKTIVQ